jgi:hypothetical protein
MIRENHHLVRTKPFKRRTASGTVFCMKQIVSALLPLLVIVGTPVSSAMSGDEFEAYVTGKTLYFGRDGQAYGVEEYLPDRQVRWSFLDGKCKEGFWYEEAGMICFVYDDNPSPQCWTFVAEPGGLRATFENNPDSTILYEAQQADEPMLCYGPDVGV